MKHIGIAVFGALLALSTLAPAAHAVQGIYGTMWEPKDTDGKGYGFGFRSTLRVNPYISFDTRASWVKFKDDDLNVIPIEATAMLKLGMVYTGIGGGYYVFDSNNNVDLDNNFGWYALAGIDVPAGPVGVFAEVKWLELSTDGHITGGVAPASGSSTSAHLEANGLGFNIGVMFAPKI
ncbi:MAG TPA: hypothetical protein VJS69_12530 [Candidatus Krumholzibacteria bacterium]|nr:hypothetical protein [Candidatus Krumholzibacteria bacterium]